MLTKRILPKSRHRPAIAIKNKIKYLAVAFVLFANSAQADEGMWLPTQLTKLYPQMKSLGCNLTPADIYDINNASLKDAIVQFANYCTAEIVSSKGLLFTNHHCGYESIAGLSSTSANYLKKGFYAKNHSQELPVPGLTVSRLVYMEDVTDRVNKDDAIEANIANIVAKIESTTGYKAEIKPLFFKNKYFVFVYEVFKDIRFVGAPAESIGKFGGNTDNWMWPRHTGDFSIFRIYTDENNQPADYSTNNVPYSPVKHLTVSLEGIKKDDFAMIMGFPGSTSRYLTTKTIAQNVKYTYPAREEVLDERLAALDKIMARSEEKRLELASLYAQLANTYKYYKGVVQASENVAWKKAKTKFIQDFSKWVKADNQRQTKYGSLVEKLNTLSVNKTPYEVAFSYIRFGFYNEFAQIYNPLSSLMQLAESDTTEIAMQKAISDVKMDVRKIYSQYYPKLAEELLADALRLGADMDTSLLPEFYESEKIKKFAEVCGADCKYIAYASYIFDESVLADTTELMELLDNFKPKKLKDDPGYLYAKQLFDCIIEVVSYRQIANYKQKNLNGKWGEALLDYYEKPMSPNANFTLRITYGTVQPYMPKDGVKYRYYTTAQGILEKYQPGDDEFDAPAALLTAIKNKSYGRYANKKGELPVCFLTNLDITGGNSGSPCLDAQGRLIGLAFDGNWEGMMGDMYFNPELQRCISVDIRYVLFCIDVVGNADYLIEELTIEG